MRPTTQGLRECDPPGSAAEELWTWEGGGGEKVSASNVRDLVEAVGAYRSSLHGGGDAKNRVELSANSPNQATLEVLKTNQLTDTEIEEVQANMKKAVLEEKEHLQGRSIRARKSDVLQFLRCRRCDLYFFAEQALKLHSEVGHDIMGPIRSLDTDDAGKEGVLEI